MAAARILFSPGRFLNRINTLTLAGLLLSAGCVLSSAQPSAPKLESARGFTWVVDTVDHFVLHIEQGSSAERRTDLLAFQLDRARERALHVLDLPDFPGRIDVFVVPSRNRMDELIGRSIDGIAFHESKVITLVMGDSLSGSPAHEVFHVIVMNSWGLGPTWLNEGMSVYAAGAWQGRDANAIARELLSQGQLVSIERLTGQFRAVDPRVGYPQAASLVRFIHDRYRTEALHALWVGDEQAFAKLAGTDLAGVDGLWREWLAR